MIIDISTLRAEKIYLIFASEWVEISVIHTSPHYGKEKSTQVDKEGCKEDDSPPPQERKARVRLHTKRLRKEAFCVTTASVQERRDVRNGIVPQHGGLSWEDVL